MGLTRTKTDHRFHDALTKVAKHSRLSKEQHYIQHGDTSCLLHSIAVAYYSYRIAKKLGGWHLSFKERELIRGALLHDYFLYDWHVPEPDHKLHGFHHPKKALDNAEQDFELNLVERDIISKHMFPLTLTPPVYRESVLVSLVDKGCSLYETFKKGAYQNTQIQIAYQQVLISE